VLESVPATVKAIRPVVGTVKETVAELPERRVLGEKLPKLHTRFMWNSSPQSGQSSKSAWGRPASDGARVRRVGFRVRNGHSNSRWMFPFVLHP